MSESTSYDEVPYHSRPISSTHPNTLATVATLLGLEPPRVEGCRVLELGCATGGNLISMALTLPGGRFVGIDLSPAQVADGRRVVAELGVSNVELQALSITDVGDEFGTFDYIICHGVYSWVPADVQDKILDICVRHLSPDGVAYISYNTYPGWHLRGMVRDMARYASRSVSQSDARVEKSRALLDFVARAVPDQDGWYASFLRHHAHSLSETRDCYFFHDYLESENHPLYFHQFAERLDAKGLKFVGEPEIDPLWVGRFSDETLSAFEETAQDRREIEQVTDFLRCRSFRRSLICHGHHRLDREGMAQRLSRLRVASMLRPAREDSDDAATDDVVEFSWRGKRLSVNDPAVKVALDILGKKWPQTVPFSALLESVRSTLSASDAGDARTGENADPGERLGSTLLHCYADQLVDLYVHTPRFSCAPAPRPVASPIARLQARTGARHLTNLRHGMVETTDMDRLVLERLDGTQTTAALLDFLVDLASSGHLEIRTEAGPVREAARIPQVTRTSLDERLRCFADNALLIR